MDYWAEILALGADALIFGICTNLYMKYNCSIKLVERAQRNGINPDFDKLTDDAKNYAVYQGNIKAVGRPIISSNAPNVSGVIQRITIKEHAFARGTAGFWSDHSNIIKEAYNTVPFMLVRGNTEVHILDPLAADVLDLDTIHDSFESKSLSFMDHIVGYFHGFRQRGIETTEELLKEDTIITAIGEISKNTENKLQLSPSGHGYPYFLVSMPVSSLLRKLEEHKFTFKLLSLLFGSIGLILASIFTKRWWLKRQAKLKDEEIKRRLELSRKERRKNVRSNQNLTENELCIICKENPKEIIVLPCGHVSMCEDCSENVISDCPVCRSPIINKAAAFIS